MAIPVIIKHYPPELNLNQLNYYLTQENNYSSIQNIYPDNKISGKMWILLNDKSEAEDITSGKHFIRKRKIKFNFDPDYLKKLYNKKIEKEYRLYINNVDSSVEAEDLFEAFSRYGEIESVFMKKLKYEKKYRGEDSTLSFCFVCFLDERSFRKTILQKIEIEQNFNIRFFVSLEDSRVYNTQFFSHLERRKRVGHETNMYRPEKSKLKKSKGNASSGKKSKNNKKFQPSNWTKNSSQRPEVYKKTNENVRNHNNRLKNKISISSKRTEPTTTLECILGQSMNLNHGYLHNNKRFFNVQFNRAVKSLNYGEAHIHNHFSFH